MQFGVQTNAILLDRDMATALKTVGVKVGVSLDGGQRTNDRRRLDHRGRGSYEAARNGVRTLLEVAPEQFAGILAVIDVEADPIETFDSLASFVAPDRLFAPPRDVGQPAGRTQGRLRPNLR